MWEEVKRARKGKKVPIDGLNYISGAYGSLLPDAVDGLPVRRLNICQVSEHLVHALIPGRCWSGESMPGAGHSPLLG